jgi:hypothetical protein
VHYKDARNQTGMLSSSCFCLEESDFFKKVHQRYPILEELSSTVPVIDMEALAKGRPATLLYVAFSAENIFLCSI